MTGMAHHKASLSWLNKQFGGHNKIGIPWESLIAFIRVTTNNRIFERALSVEQAWKQVEEWLSGSLVWIPLPTEDHQNRLSKLIHLCASSPGLIHDAHLAIIAMSHGLELNSVDSDFSRFKGLAWCNPLEA